MRLNFHNAARWMHCRLSVHPAERPVDWSTDAANEGTAAARIADGVLFGTAHSVDDYAGETIAGVDVTMEMLEHVAGYIDAMHTLTYGAVEFGFEHEAAFGPVTGRVDAFARYPHKLIVGDLKYGFRPVDVIDNWQLTLAALALSKGEPEIMFVIYQPRIGRTNPMATHTISIYELHEKYAEVMERLRTIREPSVGVPDTHCYGCAHAAECVALGVEIRNADLMDDLADLRRIHSMIKTRIAATEADMLTRIEGGEHIPGWYVGTKSGNRRFRVDPATVEMLTGVPASKTVPLSPSELEREGANKQLVNGLTYRPEGKSGLVEWSAKRVANMFKR